MEEVKTSARRKGDNESVKLKEIAKEKQKQEEEEVKDKHHGYMY